MKIREITENMGMPTIAIPEPMAQGVGTDGSTYDLDTDIGTKDKGTLVTDKDGNLVIKNPGEQLDPGQTPADKNLLKNPAQLKTKMDQQAKVLAKKQAQAPAGNQPQSTTGTTGTV